MEASGRCSLPSGEAPSTTMEVAAAAAEHPVPEGCSSATVLPLLMPGAARADVAPASCVEMHLLEVLHFDCEPPSAQVKGGAAIQIPQRARLRQRQRALPPPMPQLPGRRLLQHPSLCRLLSTRSAHRSCSSSTRRPRKPLAADRSRAPSRRRTCSRRGVRPTTTAAITGQRSPTRTATSTGSSRSAGSSATSRSAA
jgi:hypothetical protein